MIISKYCGCERIRVCVCVCVPDSVDFAVKGKNDAILWFLLLSSCACRCVQVLWLASEDRELIHALDPELQQMSGEEVSVRELKSNKISRLNLHYSAMSQQKIR